MTKLHGDDTLTLVDKRKRVIESVIPCQFLVASLVLSMCSYIKINMITYYINIKI